MKFATALLITLALAIKVDAATIRVPQDQSKIQAAVDVASSGDTVLVGPGVYSGNGNIDISFRGKSIILVSSAGYLATILDGLNSGFRAISLSSGEDSNSVISGFTFTRFHGGAIRCYGASPRVENNKFTFNSTGDGAAIYVTGGAMKIRSNQFYGNFASRGGALFAAGIDNGTLEVVGNKFDSCRSGSEGGGAYLQLITSGAIIRQNVFSRVASPMGGAIRLATANNVEVINNTFDQNWAAEGGGIDVANSFGATVRNNIFLNTSDGHALYLRNSADEDYNCFFSNLPSHVFGAALDPTDILTDPQFSSSDSSDYDLEYFSPCVDAGDPNPIYNDPDGSRSDIGAFPLRAQANVIHVPQDFPTIQAAINALYFADTIAISAGIYTENLDCKGKFFNLIGVDGPDSVIIAAADSAEPLIRYPVVGDGITPFLSEVMSIQGITFTNSKVGSGLIIGSPGGQINHSLRIENCQFENNGGDVNYRLIVINPLACYSDTAGLIIKNCRFTNNRGIALTTELEFSCGAIVDSTTFEQNTGSIVELTVADRNLVIRNSTFNSNSGLLVKFQSGNFGLFNSTFSQNYGTDLLVGQLMGEMFFAASLSGNYFDSNSYAGSLITVSEKIPDTPGGSVSLSSNVFRHNVIGALFDISSEEGGEIENNLIFDNDFAVNSCALCGINSDEGRYRFHHNIISNNMSAVGMVMDSSISYPFDHFEAHSNDSWNNELGNFGGDVDSTLNISADPLFCDAANGNFTLAAQSPAVGMGPFGVGCSAVLDIESLELENQQSLHVTSPQPTMLWQATKPFSLPQTSFEIAVSTDNDWQFAEMWDPAPFATADTFVVYNGAPLLDGQTYWLRLRVSNSLGWSNWSELTFRMNSLPTIPTLVSPASGTAANNTQPFLVINNSSDAESDSLYYTFEIANDSAMTSPHSIIKKQDPAATTSVMVDIALVENAKYFWHVKASDYYEESAHSTVRSFYVNASNSAPNQFSLTAPANSFSPPLATKTPTLQWTQAIDSDPFDAVSYALHLALDSNFSFAHIIPEIASTQFVIVDPLTWGTRYWWKVKATDLNGGETWSSQTFQFRTMKVGDNDANGIINITDIVYIINYIFASGPAPLPPAAGDANCDDRFNITDAVYLINYIFADGPPPCEAGR